MKQGRLVLLYFALSSVGLARIGETFEDCEARYGPLTQSAPEEAEFVLMRQGAKDTSWLEEVSYESFASYRFSYIEGLSEKTRGRIVREEPSYKVTLGNYELILRFMNGICHFVGYRKNVGILSNEEASQLVERNFRMTSMESSRVDAGTKYFFNRSAPLNEKLGGAARTQDASDNTTASSYDPSPIRAMIRQAEEAALTAKTAGNTSAARRWESTAQTLEKQLEGEARLWESKVQALKKQLEDRNNAGEGMAVYDEASGTLVIYSRKMFALMKKEALQSQKAIDDQSQENAGAAGFDQL